MEHTAYNSVPTTFDSVLTSFDSVSKLKKEPFSLKFCTKYSDNPSESWSQDHEMICDLEQIINNGIIKS